MADVLTDAGTQYANLLAAGYDRYLEYQLRSEPIFRQFVDKRPVDVTNPGPTVTLTIINEIANLATTPLSEALDVAAVAPPAPTRVTLGVNEYGNVDLATLKLKTLAFTSPDPAIAYTLGKNMVDTYDQLVKSVVDSGTNILGLNATQLKSNLNGFAQGSVASGDVFTANLGMYATTLLRRRNAHGRDGADQFVGVMHPDVSVDIMNSAGWVNPHTYVDTTNIYNGEIGSYMGTRWVQSPRCTKTADGASSANVYRSYVFGRQALVEASVIEPHVVVGPQVDRLRRFFPIGWYGFSGWAIFRQEALQQIRTSSSIAAI